MNQSDLLFQMVCAAVQSAQTGLTHSAGVRKQESGQDFKSLLEEKRTELDAQGAQPPTQEGEKPEENGPGDVLAQAAALAQTAQAPVVTLPGQEAPQAAELTQTATADQVAALPQAQVPAETAEGLAQALPEEAAAQVQTVQTPADAQPDALAGQPREGAAKTDGAEAPAAEATPAPREERAAESQTGQETGGQESAGAESGRRLPTDDYEAAVDPAPAERPLFQTGESLPQRVGDAPVLDTQSGEMDAKLTKELTTALEAGTQRLELKLTPEHLGSVVVEMARTPEGVLHVVLHTESEQAARLLHEHSGALGAMLQSGQQGEVRIEVRQSDQSEQPWQQPDQNGGQSGREDRQQQEQRRQSADPDGFLQQLRLGLIPVEG